MSDAGRELADLKREIVEARNQAIKTDNQVKNLTLDIKGFEKRFDGLEGRVRLSSVGVNLIVAVTIAVAAYVVSTVRIKGYETDLATARAAVKEEHDSALTKGEDMRNKLAELEKKRRAHEQASDVATQVLTLLDNKQDKEAGDMLDKLDIEQLTPLERRVAEKRFGDLRHREAETAYRAGRNAVLQYRFDAALPELRRALALEPEGHGATGRYLLATALYSVKHYDEAEPLLRELVAKGDDKSLVEECKYYLAAALARLNKRDESKLMFGQINAGNGRFGSQAKTYMAALEGESDLPTDLPGGRVRAVRRTTTAQTAEDTSGAQ